MTAPTMVSIRPANEVELDAIQVLWELCDLRPATPDEWSALTSGDTSVVLVAVHPAQRRQGVAHALLEEAEQYLLGPGARHVFVSVHEDNTEGLALVGSEGYLPGGEIVFTKRLATHVS